MKVAIVHDWLANMGGAERIIKIFHELFPEAPIYTCVYNKESMPEEFRHMDIRTTFIQKLPFGKKRYQMYLPLMPVAFEQLDLSEYDLVLSSSTSCAKGVITRADTCHICYCNTPMRYAWDFYHEYTNKKSFIVRALIAMQMNRIRQWDRLSADRVDYFIANSKNIARRIQKHYRRESEVIYPPVRTSFYALGDKNEDYYLIVSRLVPYKRIDLAVEAFNELDLPLMIIGDGSELLRLKKMAGNNIKFLGKIEDDETKIFYSNCKAFVFCGEEDFGITPLEAQSCGKPVIAYAKGGALETVIDKVTGVFFKDQTKESLILAIDNFENRYKEFDSFRIRQHALDFSEENFKDKISNFISSKMVEFHSLKDNYTSKE